MFTLLSILTFGQKFLPLNYGEKMIVSINNSVFVIHSYNLLDTNKFAG